MAADQRAQAAFRPPATCCSCDYLGSRHDKLVQASNGHWSCANRLAQRRNARTWRHGSHADPGRITDFRFEAKVRYSSMAFEMRPGLCTGAPPAPVFVAPPWLPPFSLLAPAGPCSRLSRLLPCSLPPLLWCWLSLAPSWLPPKKVNVGGGSQGGRHPWATHKLTKYIAIHSKLHGFRPSILSSLSTSAIENPFQPRPSSRASFGLAGHSCYSANLTRF